MAFTELNSVEHYIINQMSGVNLNASQDSSQVNEPRSQYSTQWQFQSAEQLGRSVNEVLVESQVKAALLRLNPEIQSNPALADEVVHALRAI